METATPTNWEMFKRGFGPLSPVKLFFSWEIVYLPNMELLRQQAYEDLFLLKKKYQEQFVDTSAEEKKILNDFTASCRLDLTDANPVAWEKALLKLEEKGWEGLEKFRPPLNHWAYNLGAIASAASLFSWVLFFTINLASLIDSRIY
jgi:hypothetical protein